MLRFVYCLFFAPDSFERHCGEKSDKEIDGYIQKLYPTVEKTPETAPLREQHLQNRVHVYNADGQLHLQDYGTVFDPAYVGARVKEVVFNIVPPFINLFL